MNDGNPMRTLVIAGAGFMGKEHWCRRLDELSRKAGKPYFAPCKRMRAGAFERATERGR